MNFVCFLLDPHLLMTWMFIWLTLIHNQLLLTKVTTLTLIPSLIEMIFWIWSVIEVIEITKIEETLHKGMNQGGINHDKTLKI